MSFCRDDRTKHNIYSSMVRSCNSTPSRKCFTIGKAGTPVSVDGPSLKIIASFARFGTNVGEMRISGFGTRQVKSLILDSRYVSCQTGHLVCVSIGRSDSLHETNSPFHAITKVSRILNISAVVIMGIDKSVNEAHYNDPILETS